MGFLSFLKKDKPEPEPIQPDQVKLEELQDWFVKNFESRLSESRKATQGMYIDIGSSFSKMAEDSTQLENASFKGGEKAHVAANMVKTGLVKKVGSTNTRFPTFRPEYSFIDSFCRETGGKIAELLSLTPKQAFLLSRYFSKESTALIGSIRSARDQTESLARYIRGEGVVIFLSHQIESKLAEHKELSETLSELKKRATDIDSVVKASEISLGKTRTDLKEFISSIEWVEHKKRTEDIVDMGSKIVHLKADLSTRLSSAKRPLKKLSHTGEHSLDGFMKEPLETLMGSSEVQVKKQLEDAVFMIREKSLSLKPKELEKIEDLIRSLGSDIPRMRTELIQLQNRLGQMKEKDPEETLEKKDLLERRLEQEEAEIGKLKEDLEKAQASRKESLSRISELKKELENIVNNNTEKQVTLDN